MRNSGLYIHVPFCRTKCVYCDFYSITDTDLIDAWLGALEREAAQYRCAFPRFDTIYLGGGTPSLLDAQALTRLFEGLRRCFAFSSDAEITMEANPDDVTQPGLSLLASLGVNRLSLGVQSFDDRDLAFLKRRHDADGAVRALGAAKDAGFTNVGLDLIYGLPGQTRKAWTATLERALSLRPTHLSCYQLTVEGHTPLAAMAQKGAIRLPNDERTRSLFLATSKLLEASGFIHYEVSNFAASEKFFCRHNSKYWTGAPYLGLGPAAHSFDGSRRWWNHRSIADYCGALKEGKKPIQDAEVLSLEQLALERCYLGLRTNRGIGLEELPESATPVVRRLCKARLARLKGDRVILSSHGLLIADSLPVLLF